MRAEGSVLNRRDLANKTQSFVRKYTYIYHTISTFLLQIIIIIIIYLSTYFISSKFPSLTWRHGTYIISLYSIAGKCWGNLISRRGVMERAANRSCLYPYNIILLYIHRSRKLYQIQVPTYSDDLSILQFKIVSFSPTLRVYLQTMLTRILLLLSIYHDSGKNGGRRQIKGIAGSFHYHVHYLLSYLNTFYQLIRDKYSSLIRKNVLKRFSKCSLKQKIVKWLNFLEKFNFNYKVLLYLI